MTCPHCGHTDRYTDPLGNTRCTGCFNHVPGNPAPPIGQLHDLDAPMVIHPQPPIRGSATQ